MLQGAPLTSPASATPLVSPRTAALLTAIVAIGALSIDMFLPSLPAMVRELGSDEPSAQLTVTLFLAAFAAAQLLFGPLSDRLGRRRALLAGLGLYVAGGLACLLAPTVPLLVGARVAQGLGAGSGPVVGRAIVRDVYPVERAARVAGLMATAHSLTPILAPILGGYLQVWLGWRAVFAALVALGALFLAGAWRALGETAPRRDPRSPRPGALLAEGRSLLGHREFVGFTLATTLVFSGQFAFISGSAFVLIGTLGLSPAAYGYCFGMVALGLMAGSFLTARHTLRLGPRRLIARGAVLAAAAGTSMLALVLAGRTSAPGILIPMFLYAVAGGLVMPNAMAGAIGPFPRAAGLASALLGFFQMAGSAAYSIAVSRLHDGTARPMAAAIAASGIATLLCHALLLRRPGPSHPGGG